MYPLWLRGECCISKIERVCKEKFYPLATQNSFLNATNITSFFCIHLEIFDAYISKYTHAYTLSSFSKCKREHTSHSCFFHLMMYLEDHSTSLYKKQSHSFLWLLNIPLYGCTKIHLRPYGWT